MKNVLVILLFVPMFLFGQRVTSKKTGDTERIDFKSPYLVARDTAANGVITVVATPINDVVSLQVQAKKLEREIARDSISIVNKVRNLEEKRATLSVLRSQVPADAKPLESRPGKKRAVSSPAPPKSQPAPPDKKASKGPAKTKTAKTKTVTKKRQ